MRGRRWEAAIPLALSAGAFGLAFAQRPGLASTDTKINLHVDPGRYVADVASMWTSTGSLGQVQAGQQAGYLFPMGPFFAVGHGVGLSAWVVQRLWLGALLALAAWGVVRLLDALLGPPRGVAHAVAGVVTVLNPFVVVYANRTTVTLLAYAALPWLLVVVHRGLRDARAWRWPAAFALLVAASGPGVNAAVTAWMLLGPALLLLYEVAFAAISWRRAGAFLARAVPVTLVVSLWWIVPAYVQASDGIDFLHFTEQPGTVWGTTSVTESLRLMSFWLSYVGVGFTGQAIPYFDDSRLLLFSPAVVVATLLLPAAALAGYVWTRRWRYGPFFLALALVAVLIMAAGFPDGTPLRDGLTFTYNRVAAVRFLRTSYKAAPLLAIALACLAGAGASETWRRLSLTRRPLALGAALALAGAAVVALAAWPLTTGRAQDAQVSWKRIPAAWRAAARDLDRELPANTRAAVLPGELFSFYRWGGTVDPLLPALSRRPVAERSEIPYADLHATDLLWTIDGLVHQRRLLPGQLPPLLALIGARAVVTGSDADPARSDAPPPADAASELAAQAGFTRPARVYGPVSRFASSDLGKVVALPEVRRYDLPPGRGLVRVEPTAAPIVVDGSADALAELAAFDALPADRALLYAADLSSAQLRQAAAPGAEVVISDSNRRRAFVSSRLEQNAGATLTAAESVSADGIMLDPFGRGPDSQTVAVLHGVRALEAPASPQRPQFPEHQPLAALDGSPQTAWLADPTLDPSRRWLQIDFDRPRDVPYLDLLPYGDAGGTVRGVEVGGHRFAIGPGWNRLTLGLRHVSSVRVSITEVTPPLPGAAKGAGGISELRVPGLEVSEELRLPQDAARGLAGRDLRSVGVTYLFQRTTGDAPYLRNAVHGPWSSLDVRDAGDAEATIQRSFELPAARAFSADAWVTVAPRTPDDALDRLAGYHGPVQATSSSRFEGRPRWRASRALDGDPNSAWIGGYAAGQPAWLAWRTPRPTTVRTLRLVAPREPVRRPTRVRVRWPGGVTPSLAVAADGRVVLPAPVRAAAFEIDILGAVAPSGASAAERGEVGIAEVRGVAGLSPVRAPRSRAITTRCDAVRVGVDGATLPLSVAGSADTFEAGGPLRARGCGAPTVFAPGRHHLATATGVFAVDDLRLVSAPLTPPSPPAGTAAGGGRVVATGHAGRGRYDGVRVAPTGPSWLVLGEGYNRGWRAWCNGRNLGTPAVIDGYANGWRVGPSCQRVRFAFAPNGLAHAGFVASALAGLACLALLVGVARRRRRRVGLELAAPEIPTDTASAWPLGRAALAGVLAGAAFGFVFGVTAGVLSVPAIALVLWRGGIGARPLTLAAGALLGVAVPVLYLADPGNQGGGNHFSYATDHITAHWVGVAALGLLMGALWRTLRPARRPSTTPPGKPPAGEPAPLGGADDRL